MIPDFKNLISRGLEGKAEKNSENITKTLKKRVKFKKIWN